MCPATRKALATMVKLGFTPLDVGMKLPSSTYRFASPRQRQVSSSAAVAADSPNRIVPTAWEKVSISNTRVNNAPADLRMRRAWVTSRSRRLMSAAV